MALPNPDTITEDDKLWLYSNLRETNLDPAALEPHERFLCRCAFAAGYLSIGQRGGYVFTMAGREALTRKAA